MLAFNVVTNSGKKVYKPNHVGQPLYLINLHLFNRLGLYNIAIEMLWPQGNKLKSSLQFIGHDGLLQNAILIIRKVKF